MGTTPHTRRAVLALAAGACLRPAQAQVGIFTLATPVAEPPTRPSEPDRPAPAPADTGARLDLRPRDLQEIDRTARLTELGLPATRGLWLRNPHTDEEVLTLFYDRQQVLNPGYTLICKILRDWRENQVMAMDPMLLQLLWVVQRGARFERPLIINSGFRTLRTNRSLASEGAAPDSYHLRSSACDVVLDGIPPAKVAEYVHGMRRGGVGFYDRFTHIDTGPVRTWRA